MAVRAFIGLGSNLGDSAGLVRAAIGELGQLEGCSLVKASSLYRTAPIASIPQPDYINAVAEIETDLHPHEVLKALLALELRHGRMRSVADAPRTLDLDLLLYGDAVLDQANLKLPHPRMHQRAFVLAPLTEIAPDCEIPGHGRAADYLSRLNEQRIEVIT
jgi:2-amino-4-hydroxy-6-hydroxymethyldihydropteridine diphosphokinase